MQSFTSNATYGSIAAVWGILGVVGILGWAIVRLAPIAAGAFDHTLEWYHWATLLIFLAFMLYSEGYRGFQRSFSPRVAERAGLLRKSPTPLNAILAPLYCIGYFNSSRRIKLTVYILTSAIVVMILIVHRFSQPWRGIVDVGVLAGLSYGIVSTLVLGRHVFRGARSRP
ncbi:MAG: hypothetical protein GY716_15635 [bacterium]|nr:hypothetical protein [bacterium]